MHARKSIWESIYGKVRHTYCFVCRFNEIGWENSSFDLAHVVARSAGGNNSCGWNRFATCSTCNQKVAINTNLLDFISEHYPARLIPVVLNLWQRFRAAEPYVARHCFSTLESFVRTMYGRHGSRRGAQFLRRLLPDYDDEQQQQQGRIKDERVYAHVRYYDELASERKAAKRNLRTLTKEIDSLHKTMERLQSGKNDAVARIGEMDKEIARLEQHERKHNDNNTDAE